MSGRQINQTSLTDRIPWKSAAITGLIAFALVFVLIFGLFAIEYTLQDSGGEVDAGDTEVDDTPGFLTQLGWGTFGAHFVDLKASVTTGFSDAEESINVLNEWIEKLPTIMFHLVPILVLIISGFILVRRNVRLVNSEKDSAIFGATIISGYLPTVIFATFIFDWQTEIDNYRVTYEIPLGEAVLIAGILFPVLFGAIGGYLAYSNS